MSYDYTKVALLHPERIPAFRGYAPSRRFDPRPRDDPAHNAWFLANASHLAYHDRAATEETLRDVGCELVDFFDSGRSTQGFLARGDGFAILAFRGTEPDDFRDLLRDVDTRPAVFPGTEARVHAGFLEALDEVWPTVAARLGAVDDVPVWYTGHSLGAALATLAAARIPPAGVATFGSPRVGDPAFGERVADVRIVRVVLCSDVVTTLPPLVLPFRHVGTEWYITSQEQVVCEPPPPLTARDRRRGRRRFFWSFRWLDPRNVLVRELADHAIVNYVAALEG